MKKGIIVGMFSIFFIAICFVGYTYIDNMERQTIDIHETWKAYEVSKDEVNQKDALMIERVGNHVTITFDSKVCTLNHNGSNAPHKCKEELNWYVMIDRNFNAIVIEEDTDTLPIYYLGVYDKKPFFRSNNSNIKELVEELSQTASVIFIE